MGVVCCAHAIASQKRRLYGKLGLTSQREIVRVKLEGLRWLDRRGYFAPGSLRASGDARNEARQRASDRWTVPNVHGAADSAAGRCYTTPREVLFYLSPPPSSSSGPLVEEPDWRSGQYL